MREPCSCIFFHGVLVLALLAGDMLEAEREGWTDTPFALAVEGMVQPVTRVANMSIAPHQLLQIQDYATTSQRRHPGWLNELCGLLTLIGGFRESYNGTSDGVDTRRSLRIVCVEGAYSMFEWYIVRQWKFVLEAELFNFKVIQRPDSREFEPVKDSTTLLARLHLSNSDSALVCHHASLSGGICYNAEIHLCDDTATVCTLQMKLNYENFESYSLYSLPTLSCSKFGIDKTILRDSLQPAKFAHRFLMAVLKRYQGFASSDGNWALHVLVDYRPDGSGLVANAQLISTNAPSGMVSWRREEAQFSAPDGAKPMTDIKLKLGVPHKTDSAPKNPSNLATCDARLEMSFERKDRKWTRAGVKLFCGDDRTAIVELWNQTAV